MVDSITETRSRVNVGIKDSVLDGKAGIVVQPDILGGGEISTRDKAKGGERAYMVEGVKFKQKDPNTYSGILERAIEVFESKSKEKAVVGNEEVGRILKIIDNVPGGKRESRRELRSYVVGMVAEVDFDNAEKNWKDINKRPTRLLARRKNPKLALIYDYVEFHGGNPQDLDWKALSVYAKVLQQAKEKMQVDKTLLEELVEHSGLSGGDRQKRLEKLLEREGHTPGRKWKREEDRERAFDLLLAFRNPEATVDVVSFWKERLLKATEKRLDAVRGEFNWRVSKKRGEENKLVWEFEGPPPKDENIKVKFTSGFRTSMLAEDHMNDFFTGQGEVALFLSEMGRGDYWEGKRKLDKAFWSKLMGQVEDENGGDLFDKLDDSTLQGGLRAVAGADAQQLWALDENTRHAQHVLFAEEEEVYDPENNDHYWRPVDLREGVRKLRLEGIPERSVQEAIMIAQVNGLDMRNCSSKDRRFTTNKFRAYYLAHGWVTDIIGRKLELTGEGFGLTDTCANKMQMYDPRNADVLYAANNNDRASYKPDKLPPQRDKMWQSGFFYLGVGLRGIDGGRKTVTVPESRGDYGKPGELMPDDIVLPGHLGEFWEYTHMLRLKDPKVKDEKTSDGKCYIHRRAIFRRLTAVLAMDLDYRKKGYKVGKPGYGKKMKIHRDIPELSFNENDEVELRVVLAKMLKYFTENGRNAEVNYKDKQIGDLVTRVLRNAAAWGILFSHEDPETFELMRKRSDLQVAMEYELKAKSAGGAILGALGMEAFTLPVDSSISPKMLRDIENNKLHHRYNKVQSAIQMQPLYEYAIDISLLKLGMMMPDQQQMEQFWGEQEIGRLGMMQYVKALTGFRERERVAREKILDILDEWEDHYEDEWKQTYVGQNKMANSMFIYRETNKRLSMIREGAQAGADMSLGVIIDKLRTSRALTWANARDLVWQKRAGMWSYVAELSGRDLPKWQHLDVVWGMDKGGGLGSGGPEMINGGAGVENMLAIQDVQPEELEKFFNFFQKGSPDYNKIENLYIDMGFNKLHIKRSKMLSETGLLVFKGEKERTQFFMSRTRTLLNLFYGRDGGASVVLPENIFWRDEKGKLRRVGDSKLVRQVHELYEKARAVDRTNIYINIEKLYLKSVEEGKQFISVSREVKLILEQAKSDEALRHVDVRLINDAVNENAGLKLMQNMGIENNILRFISLQPLSQIRGLKFVFGAKIFGGMFDKVAPLGGLATGLVAWASFGLNYFGKGTLSTFMQAQAVRATGFLFAPAMGTLWEPVIMSGSFMLTGLLGIATSFVLGGMISNRVFVEFDKRVGKKFGKMMGEYPKGYPEYLLDPQKVVEKYQDSYGEVKDEEIQEMLYDPKFK